jgi:hypothetical protein
MTGSEMSPRRASDSDRDRTVRQLRDAAVDGRLSQDSFVRRVDLALRAKHHHALAELVTDLPSCGVGGSFRAGWTALTVNLRGERRSTLPTLSLPDRSRPVLIVGRRSDCDVVLSDTTVSRSHAVLMLFGGQWFIHDQQSSNGTRVNGRRVWGTAVIEAGDRVSFGRLTFRLVHCPDAVHR